jgi:hypothetical protein
MDYLTFDMIWLTFVKQRGEVILQINEEAEGFADLMTAMNKAFSTIDQEWYQQVMLPPFEENRTVLFER